MQSFADPHPPAGQAEFCPLMIDLGCDGWASLDTLAFWVYDTG